MITDSRYLMLSLLAAFLFMDAGTPASAAIKCWTNREGVRECGDRVPPEYAQQGHQELSKQGMVIEEQNRARTEEEMAAEQRAREEAEQARLAKAERDREDRILLSTFSKVEDIEIVRDERLKALEASIKLAEKRTETIQADLDKRIQAAAEAERAGKAPNADLLKDIESLRRQINNNNEYIAEKQQEAGQTREEYAANIARFRELKGLSASPE